MVQSIVDKYAVLFPEDIIQEDKGMYMVNLKCALSYLVQQEDYMNGCHFAHAPETKEAREIIHDYFGPDSYSSHPLHEVPEDSTKELRLFSRISADDARMGNPLAKSGLSSYNWNISFMNFRDVSERFKRVILFCSACTPHGLEKFVRQHCQWH